MYDDLNDHPVAVFQAGENYVSDKERNWLRWIKRAEYLAGHSLDGDEDVDGYSLDGAYGAWEAGETTAQYVASIVR
jgi:hypothetical protein